MSEKGGTIVKVETDPLITATATPIDIESEKDVSDADKNSDDAPYGERLKDVMRTTWSLGMVAFGDTSSQVAIIEDQICVQRDWMSKETFMELFALSRALPGPLATQLVMASAITRAGAFGGFVALIIWLAPGAIVLTTIGMLVEAYMDPEKLPIVLVGVPPATAALVFKAAYGFGASLDKFGFGLAMLSCTGAVLISGDYSIKPDASRFAYPIMLALGGILTLVDALLPTPIGTYPLAGSLDSSITRHIGIPAGFTAFLVQTWLIVLLGTILLNNVEELGYTEDPYVDLFESFFRIGSVTFGGGEDVLAMLESEMVPRIVTKEQFFQGLGLAQALPGPLFNFSAYLGAVYADIPGALLSLLAMFTPAYIFMLAALPLWARLRQIYWFKAILKGINAVAIGYIAAATIFLWERSVNKAADAMVFVISGGLATYYNLPPPIVILVAMGMGAILCEDVASLGQVPYDN